MDPLLRSFGLITAELYKLLLPAPSISPHLPLRKHHRLCPLNLVITRPLALHRHSCAVSLIANGSFTCLVRALILVLPFVTCPASGKLPDPISSYINRSEGSVLSTLERSEVLAQRWVGSGRLISGCSCGLSRRSLCGGHFRSAKGGGICSMCLQPASLHAGVSQRAV